MFSGSTLSSLFFLHAHFKRHTLTKTLFPASCLQGASTTQTKGAEFNSVLDLFGQCKSADQTSEVSIPLQGNTSAVRVNKEANQRDEVTSMLGILV